MHELTLLNKIVANMASLFYGNAHEPFELEEFFQLLVPLIQLLFSSDFLKYLYCH